MKCDHCGRQFPARQARRDSLSEQIGPAGLRGAPTKTVYVTLCPDCAENRHGMFWFILWAFVAVFLLLGVIVAVFG
jgi:hypothetical protein